MHADAAVWLCTGCDPHAKEPTLDATHRKQAAPCSTHQALRVLLLTGTPTVPINSCSRLTRSSQRPRSLTNQMHRNTSHRAFSAARPPVQTSVSPFRGPAHGARCCKHSSTRSVLLADQTVRLSAPPPTPTNTQQTAEQPCMCQVHCKAYAGPRQPRSAAAADRPTANMSPNSVWRRSSWRYVCTAESPKPCHHRIVAPAHTSELHPAPSGAAHICRGYQCQHKGCLRDNHTHTQNTILALIDHTKLTQDRGHRATHCQAHTPFSHNDVL